MNCKEAFGLAWFDEIPGGPRLRKYQRGKTPRVKYGTNRHRDHSGRLSSDLATNESLADSAIRGIFSSIPGTTFTYPGSLTISFGREITSYIDAGKDVVVGRRVIGMASAGPATVPVAIRVSNLGDRGEPASVYSDRTSRFIVVERPKGASFVDHSPGHNMTQFGFHKFLNSDARSLEGTYRLEGLEKDRREEAAEHLRRYLPSADKNGSVDIGTIPVDSEQSLCSLVKLLLVIGLVKESHRKRGIPLQL